MAIEVMAEIGIDISAHHSKHLDEFLQTEVGTVITVCGNADQACPMFPGQAEKFHWPFDDPAKATGTEATATRRRHSNAGGGEFKRAASSHGAAGYAKYGIPKSPSFQDARVPKSAVPNKRVKHDQRAMSLRKPFTPQASRRGVTQGRPAARGATSRATRGAARRGASRTTSTHRREQPSRSVRDSRNVRRPSYPSRVRRSSRSRPQGRQAGVTPSHSRASRVRQPRRAAPSRSSRAARSANRARPPTPRASSTRTSPPRASSSPQSASRARSSARRSTRTKSSSSRSKRSRSRKTR